MSPTDPVADQSPGALAAEVAGAAVAVDAVVAMSGSRLGEVGTYLPGGRVPGVRLLDPGVEIHLTMRYGQPLATAAEAVRRAVLPVTGAPVDVVIEDVLAPDEVTRENGEPGEERGRGRTDRAE